MSLFRILFVFAILLCGAWIVWGDHPMVKEMVQSYVENGEFLTLEERFTADQIMEKHRAELLPDAQYVFLEPRLKFYPYLLMEVKYTQGNGRPKEGVILWGMVDGEMVIDTDTWEKTHGYEDAINAGATRSDFLLINTLAKYRGMLPVARLQKELDVDDATMRSMLNSAKSKYLIVEKNNEVFLHFQNPYFDVSPQTRVNQWLVTKPYNHAQRASERYSKRQIEKTAKASFGHDFAVRSSKRVFLPVYSIEVQNPDGSIFTSTWNALNGQRIDARY